jgi:hypothetical protein
VSKRVKRHCLRRQEILWFFQRHVWRYGVAGNQAAPLLRLEAFHLPGRAAEFGMSRPHAAYLRDFWRQGAGAVTLKQTENHPHK